MHRIELQSAAKWQRVALILWALCSACGDEGASDEGAGSGDEGNPGEDGEGDNTGASTPMGGEPAEGWERAFGADGEGVGVTCDMSYDEMVASGAPSLTFGDTQIFVGFQQYGNNQDPVFRRFDAGVEVYCEHHEKQSPDGRAVAITWDGGPTAYVVYTIVGGGTELEGKGGWIDRYGDGGASSKVTVIGAVETEFGTLQKATFVPAKKEMGTSTNSLFPAAAVNVLASGELEFWANSAYSPLNPDQTPMCMGSEDYPSALDGADGPSFYGKFTQDLGTLICGSTNSCSNVQVPCP